MKNAWKKLLVIAVAVAFIVSMVGCTSGGSGGASAPAASPGSSASSSSSGGSAPAAPSGEKTKLVYFAIQDFDTPDFFTKFEQDNNCTVQKMLYPSDKFDQALLVAINGNQQIDFGLVNGQQVRSYAAKNIITDLTGQINYMDRFTTVAANQFVFDGKMYALPATTVWVTGLFYNKAIFQQYNLQPPKTYQDVQHIAEVLKPHNIAAISVGAVNAYELTNWFFVNYYQASGNNAIQRTIDTLQGKAKFTDPDYVKAMTYVQQYAKDGMFQNGFMGADAKARMAAFETGKAAMIYTGNWDLSTMATDGMNLDDIGVVSWPLMQADVKSQVSGTAAGAAAVMYASSPAANKDLNMKALDYLTSDEMNIMQNKATGTYLTTNVNVSIPGINAVNQSIQSDLVPNLVTFLDWYWPPEVVTAMQNELQAVMGGKDTPEQAMANVQAAYDKAVADGYKYGATS